MNVKLPEYTGTSCILDSIYIDKCHLEVTVYNLWSNQSHNRMEIKCLDDRNIVSEECLIEIRRFFADSVIPIIDIDKLLPFQRCIEQA